MTDQSASATAYSPPVLPAVRKINFADLRSALSMGVSDFQHKPSYVITLAVLYPIIGLILARLSFGYHILPIVFPLVAGFALLGPIAAVGFYEISRLRERGIDPSWWDVFGLVRRQSRFAILALGALLMAIFFIWIWTAEFIFEYVFGDQPVTSLSGFVHQVFETPEGFSLMIVGNLAGFVFAAICFSVSVVSFPLLVDRDVSAPVAIVTSLKAVAANPIVMLAWAAFIVAALIVASLPFLLGLIVVLPILGHATWHLYRKVVV
jgi:uncharacterized membrane protein